MALQIREGTAADLGAIGRLLGDARLPTVGPGDGRIAFAVVADGAAVVGAAGVEPCGRFGLLRSVVLDSRLRGSGMGRALVANRVAWAAGQGLESLYLLTETARPFFERLDFHLVDRAAVPAPIRASQEFASACPASAAVMVHALRPAPEPGGDQLLAAGTQALQALARFLDDSQSGRAPVVALAHASQIRDELDLGRWIEAGGLAPEIGAFLDKYLARSTRLHHPGYMAHQVASPQVLSGLADLVHGVINNPMAIHEMGPAGATIELAVIDWMALKVGWQAPRAAGDTDAAPRPAGVLTHGGSLANLTALLAARAAVAPEAWEQGTPPDLAVLAPSAAHYSISRAVSMLGLGRRAVVPLPLDDEERIHPGRLPEVIAQTRAEGRRIMAVVANGGATSTGHYDDLSAIADVCEAEGLWLHVDGAHGASALVSPRDRHRLNGVERAHSLIWDAHKMLRTSGLCTAVLLRDERWFDAAFQQEASYLFYGEGGGDYDLVHRTVECTKAALGLKLFFSLAAEGERGLARYWEGRVDLALEAAALIRARPGFACPFTPESNIVCFRWAAGDDAAQIRIREALLREGRYYLTSTEVSGRRYLRLTMMSPSTGIETVAGMLDAVERIAPTLVAGS